MIVFKVTSSIELLEDLFLDNFVKFDRHFSIVSLHAAFRSLGRVCFVEAGFCPSKTFIYARLWVSFMNSSTSEFLLQAIVVTAAIVLFMINHLLVRTIHATIELGLKVPRGILHCFKHSALGSVLVLTIKLSTWVLLATTTLLRQFLAQFRVVWGEHFSITSDQCIEFRIYPLIP